MTSAPKPRILAIIPARAGSKRMPGKNTRLLNGVPLIERTANFAVESTVFDTVLVSSDDPEAIEIAVSAGAVSFGMRPAALSSDTASSIDVMCHEVEMAESRLGRFELVALLQPTTPFRLKARWDEAVAILTQNTNVPSVIGVAPTVQTPFHMFTQSEDGAIAPLFPEMLTRRSQDLPSAMAINGALYLIRRDRLCSDRRLILPGTRAVVCSRPEESLDIDTPEDFVVAEQMLVGIEGRMDGR